MPSRLAALILSIVAVAGVGVFLTQNPKPQVVASVDDKQSPKIELAATTSTTPPAAEATSTVQTNAIVIRVVDGDTLVAKLDSEPQKEYKVRLLGVNTPETVDPRRAVQCFGKQASDLSKKTLSGKRVRLEADPQADERDKYDRLLRNLILEDGTDFNASLVREGYANAYLSFPLNPVRKAELRRLETEAKAAKRGLWGETCE